MSAGQMRFELKGYRYKKSKIIDKPAYVIFSNAVMESVIAAQPTTTSALLRVKGFGQKKVADYGKEIIAIVSKHRFVSGSSSSSSSALMDESKGSSQETSEQHRKRHKTNSKAAPMSNNNVDVLWSGNGNTEPTGRLWTMLTDATGPVLAPLVQFSNGRIAGKKF
jgi:ribonuclease D